MILCADIGNVAVKCAAIDKDEVVGAGRFPTENVDDDGALESFVARVAQTVGAIERAVICSVVPTATRSVTEAIKRATGNEPEHLTHLTPLPFAIDVPEPGKVGSDRLAAVAGAFVDGMESVIVVDAGTAITVDVVHNRRFLGGLIMAGPQLALGALHLHASLLPDIDYAGVEPEPDLFCTTASSMVLGATHGAVGGILQAVAILEGQTGERPPKFVTGGHLAALEPLLPEDWVFVPHLTLLGLGRISA